MNAQRLVAACIATLFVLSLAIEADAAKRKRKRKKRRKAVTSKVIDEKTKEASVGAVGSTGEEPAPSAVEATTPALTAAPTAAPSEAAAAETPTPDGVVPTVVPIAADADSAAAPAMGATPTPAANATPVITEIAATSATDEPPPGAVETTVPAVEETADTQASVTAGLAVGGSVPQVVSKLGTSYVVGLDLAYLLPLLEHRLGVTVGAAYTRPAHDDGGSDTRLTAGSDYSYTVVDEELTLGLGLIFRLWSPDTPLNVYARAAGELHLQQSTVEADTAGTTFGENQEQKTAIGAVVGAGGELHVGPGALTAELAFALADLSHEITGDTSTGGMMLHLGYRFFF